MADFILADWPFNSGSDRYEGDYDGPPPNQLIIQGSGFGTKPFSTQAVWDIFAGEVGQLVKNYDPAWLPYNGDAGAVISNAHPRFEGHKYAYSDPSRGGDFLTNYKVFNPSMTVYLSMYAYCDSYRGVGHSGGAAKFQRLNSPEFAGGEPNGHYNGPGVFACGGASPNEWYGSWTGSEDLLNNIGYLNTAWFPLNTWRRIEYETKINTLDVADGFFNIRVPGFGAIKSGPIMQRKTGYDLQEFLTASTLLGVEAPNQWPYYKPNVLLANTNYTITVLGTPYTYTKPTVPTIAEILEGLRAQISAAGQTVRVWNNEEINVRGQDSATYSANFSRTPPYGMAVGEVFVDIDHKRIYIGNNPVWANCTETNPQPYTSWLNESITLDCYFGGIPEDSRYTFEQLLPDTTPTPRNKRIVRNEAGILEEVSI